MYKSHATTHGHLNTCLAPQPFIEFATLDKWMIDRVRERERESPRLPIRPEIRSLYQIHLIILKYSIFLGILCESSQIIIVGPIR